MRVRWSLEAQQRLREITAFIAKESPQAALKEATRLVERSMQLANPPLLGHRMREYPDDDVREVLERPYRLIYRVEEEQIVIIAVMHYRQRLPKAVSTLGGRSAAGNDLPSV
jgi:plasmid stabilization system protein ParE